MTFQRPTLSQLVEQQRADFDARLPGADSRVAGSVLDVFARVHPAAVHGLYGYLDHIADQVLPDTASAEALARHAAVWGVARKAGLPATGVAAAPAIDGTRVPAGTELAFADGERVATTGEAAAVDGVVVMAVEALEPGLAANRAPGTALTFAQPVIGVQAEAAVLGDGLLGGAEPEGDEGLRARLLDRIRTPPQGGSRSDYVRWAKMVPGVTRAWAYPDWQGAGTVGIAFVLDGRAAILPTPAEVATVAVAIDAVRPVTARVVTFAPAARPIDLRLRLVPDRPDVRQAVRDELADLFARDAEPGGTMRVSRLSEAVSLAAGEGFHQLELPERDVMVDPGAMPLLGDVVFVA